MRVDAIRAGQDRVWFHRLPDESTGVQALPAVILRSSDLARDRFSCLLLNISPQELKR